LRIDLEVFADDQAADARLAALPGPETDLQRACAMVDAARILIDDKRFAEAETMLGGLMQGHIADGGIAVAATHRPLPVAATATLALGRDS